MPRLRLPFTIAVVLLGATVLALADEPERRTEWIDDPLFDATTTREELLDKGRSASSLGQDWLAEFYYQELLLRDAQDVQAMIELAALYEREGRLEYARGLLVRVGQIDSTRIDVERARRRVERALCAALTREVDSLVAAGRHGAALPRISLHLSIQPGDPELRYRKAQCLVALGQADAALANLDLAIAREPRETYFELRARLVEAMEKRRLEHLEVRAKRLLESGMSSRDQAGELLTALLAQDPSHAWAREQLRSLSGTHTATPPARRPIVPTRDEVAAAFREHVPEALGTLDRLLPAMILLLGIVILFRSPLTRALAKRVHDPPLMAGDLAHVALSDVFLVINESGLSGALALRTPDGPARVYFENGEPTHCTAPGSEGARALLELAQTVGHGVFEFRPSRAPQKRTIDKPLRMILPGPSTEPSGRDRSSPRPRQRSRMAELLDSKED